MNAPNQNSFPWKPLAALIFLQAVLFGVAIGGVMLLGHLQCRHHSRPSTTTTTALEYSRTAKFEDSKQEHDSRLLPVNQRALSELKQGRWIYNPNTGENRWCPNCPPAVVVTPQPSAPIVRPTPARPAPVSPATAPSLLPTDRPVAQPTQHQIMLFLVPGDPLSAKLERWFDTNPTLMQWRQSGTFHKFTPDNKLYLTLTNRGVALRDQVPVGAFPAALFTAADGGHIHAAIRNFIPETAEELIADVGRGKANWKQMRESIPGNVAMGQYNFDDAINHKTRLNQTESDCVGPNCPVPRSPSIEPARRPGARIVDLFPNAHDKAEGIVKDAMGWLDILVTGVIVLCIVAAMVVLFMGTAFLVAYVIRTRRNQ